MPVVSLLVTPCVKTGQSARLLPSLEVAAVSMARSRDSSPKAIHNLQRITKAQAKLEEKKCVCVCVCVSASCRVSAVSKPVNCVMYGFRKQHAHKNNKLRKNKDGC